MRTGISFAIAAAVFSASAGAASVPNTFSSGEPAVASEVNANFDALISEIETVQSSVDESTSTAFSDYFVTPSSDGSLGARNVVVWRQDSGTPSDIVGTTQGNCYIARGWFTNTNGTTVESATGTVNPSQIYVWQMACGDQSQVNYELEYVYGLSSAGFSDARALEVNIDGDGDGRFETQAAFDYDYSSISTPLANSEIVNVNEMFFDGSGELITANNFSQTRRKLDRSITVNGMTFNNVMVSNFVGFDRVRFHAQGIGPILELSGVGNSDPLFNEGQSRRGVIFYRMDGEQQGDLSGTPFATGITINQWFQ